jgi:hypothetical protein
MLHSTEFRHSKNTGVRELRAPQRDEQRACPKRKPGIAGLSDEFLFRSVHFASLAI